MDKLFGRYQAEDGKRFTLQHLTCGEILSNHFLPEERFNSLFKFTVVRDPYQRCAALYYFWGGEKKWGSFNAFLAHLRQLDMDAYDHRGSHQGNPYHLLPHYKYVYKHRQELMVDFVGRFENQERDIRVVAERIGFDPGKSAFHADKHQGLLRLMLKFQQATRQSPALQALAKMVWTLRQKRKEHRYRRLYNQATRQLVKEVYAKDFELFGYS
jgi:hypothetical protein